ncbi:bestrophin-like domain [Lysobacter sp. F60174L2]|uniref:bestrophin-like domain n=1 Tax=Lysobacter sp. F60174L2 TaxID=3459295 RepID=UPI00403E285C
MDLISDDYPYMPLWLLGLVFFAALVFAREVGCALRRRLPKVGSEQEDAFAMTSVLGLLALLIGFTFSLALHRYDTRRELVVLEANSLGTTWLRSQLLDSPDRETLQEILYRYVDSRVAYGYATNAREENEAYAETEALQAELWEVLTGAVSSFRDTPRAALLITTTNESIDVAATRQATRQAHIPARILRLLALFTITSAVMVGYERGAQRRATTMLFALLTLAVTLVLDLDRPSTGRLNVPQQPLIELQESMRAAALPTSTPHSQNLLGTDVDEAMP